MCKPYRQRNLSIPIELLRSNEFHYRCLGLRWSKVLTDGQDPTTIVMKIGEDLNHLLLSFTESNHESRFCGQFW